MKKAHSKAALPMQDRILNDQAQRERESIQRSVASEAGSAAIREANRDIDVALQTRDVAHRVSALMDRIPRVARAFLVPGRVYRPGMLPLDNLAPERNSLVALLSMLQSAIDELLAPMADEGPSLTIRHVQTDVRAMMTSLTVGDLAEKAADSTVLNRAYQSALRIGDDARTVEAEIDRLPAILRRVLVNRATAMAKGSRSCIEELRKRQCFSEEKSCKGVVLAKVLGVSLRTIKDWMKPTVAGGLVRSGKAGAGGYWLSPEYLAALHESGGSTSEP